MVIRKRLAKLEENAIKTVPPVHLQIVGTALVATDDSDLIGTHTLDADNLMTFHNTSQAKAYADRCAWAAKQENVIMLQAPLMDNGGRVLDVLREKYEAG